MNRQVHSVGSVETVNRGLQNGGWVVGKSYASRFYQRVTKVGGVKRPKNRMKFRHCPAGAHTASDQELLPRAPLPLMH